MGDTARFTFFRIPGDGLPTLLTGTTVVQLRDLSEARQSLPASNELARRKLFLVADTDAARATLAEGAATVGVALFLLYILWAIAAKCNTVL